MRAGAEGRFPPIAVKLKGAMAAMKPSIPRYLIVFRVSAGLGLRGWYFVNSFAKNALNLAMKETQNLNDKTKITTLN